MNGCVLAMEDPDVKTQPTVLFTGTAGAATLSAGSGKMVYPGLRNLALACALAAITVSVSADVHLVRNGRPRAVIIVPEDAGHVTELAAREMRDYLKQASGADVPIHVEEGFSFEPDYFWLSPSYALISIGQTQLAREEGLNADDLDPEGFLIATRGNTLFILGREDRLDTTQLRSTKWLSLYWPLRRRGTLFGVYAFLEDYVGVRWLWPGDLGEVVPKRRDITVPAVDRREAPAFPIRRVRPSHMVGSYKTHSGRIGESSESMLARAIDADSWSQRLRMGQSLIIDQTHAYGAPFWERYGEEHPDWFALQPDGTRMGPPQLPDRLRLCHSNRQLQEEVARIVLDKIARNPDTWAVGAGLDDTSPESFCQCEACAASGPTLTDRVVRYDSAIADLVARSHPEKRVSMFAYAQWRDPPVEAKLHANVIVVYVGVYTHGYLYAPDREANQALWDGWARMVEGKMLWRPNMPESLGIPIVYPHEWAADLRRFAPKTWGASVDALRGSWAPAGLTQYVMAKLLWDPGLDVDAIIDDYCERGFGPAAKPMREYFATLETYTAQAARQAPAHGYHKFAPWAPTYYTDARLARLESMLDKAERLAAGDDPVRQRLRFIRVGLDWAKLSLPAWAIYAADGDRAEARPIVRRMYAMLREQSESYALYSGYLATKIGWIWKQFFGEEAEEDWSRPF